MASCLAGKAGLWGACDRGDLERVKELVDQGWDVNARNCLGCVPLMYAAGSGHVEVTTFLLGQPAICVNIRNNDRLTTFMLAMQVGRDLASWGDGGTTSGQEQLRKMMDRPAVHDTDWARNDKWTVLMEAASFGQGAIIELLLYVPGIELDAVNLRGQTAEDVANNRGHSDISQAIKEEANSRDNPEEVHKIKELENQVEVLKTEARVRLIQKIDIKYDALGDLKVKHESEMEPLTKEIDRLQASLEDAMKKRLSMITRQVSEIKNIEEELRASKKMLDKFDRNYGMGGSSPVPQTNNILDKDFECPVCYDEMAPPTRIFQCSNGHLLCEACKCHQEVRSCPTCRVPLGPTSLLRNIPLEKLAKSYFEQCSGVGLLPATPVQPQLPSDPPSQASSRRSSSSRRTTTSTTWPHDDLDSRIFDW